MWHKIMYKTLLVWSRFKLYAKKNTIVEGEIINGQIVTLKVTPEKRKTDIMIGPDMRKIPRETDNQPSPPAL